MGFTPMSADDYRALDHEALVERRNAVVALLEAEKLPEGVTTEMLAAECDIIRKDEARRELVRSMRSAQKAEVSKAPVIATSGEAKTAEDPLSTMEYRTAFMNYVIDGKQSPILQKRNDATGTSADLGVLIPQTVIQMIIEGVQGVYGQLYSRVRKFNIKGGVTVPIGSFSASFHRIAETAVSDRQDAGGITGSITFSYKIGEIRLARTLLQTVLSVPVFERRFAEVVVETYLKAMDYEIMNGVAADGEMEGILTEADKVSSRIDASHIIDFTAADMADWKSWQTNLFAKIPLSMRRERPEFVMTANTYEANIKTLADDENRPVYYETYNPVDGDMTARFKGREVVFVEEDIFENFDDATDGEYFGMYWVPEMAYAINTNLEFSVVDYFDHETNQYVKKAIVINDGKILDPKYIWLLRKDGGSTPSA